MILKHGIPFPPRLKVSSLWVEGGQMSISWRAHGFCLTESRQQAATDPEEATGALCPSSGEVVLDCYGLDF